MRSGRNTCSIGSTLSAIQRLCLGFATPPRPVEFIGQGRLDPPPFHCGPKVTRPEAVAMLKAQVRQKGGGRQRPAKQCPQELNDWVADWVADSGDDWRMRLRS
jgi:hypothetical protein